MKMLSIKPTIYKFKTAEEFAAEFKIGVGDLVITNEYIYQPFFGKLNLGCDVLYQEKYGAGEPSDDMAEAMYKDIKGDHKRVIAIGGGTVIDISKLFALKTVSPILDLYDGKTEIVKDKELVLVPTTCGTGSEVTNIAILALNSRGTKKGLAVDEMYADSAVLVPELLNGLPFRFFATSSIDALVHAVESSLSPKATPYTKLFGYKAIEMIILGYQKIAAEGREARIPLLGDFLLASNYAGLAFGTAGCAAVHALSYPLGGKYHIAHGVSNAILLAPVMRFNEPACRALLAQAYDTCVHGEKMCETQAEKSSYIIAWLEKIVKDLDIPTSLSVFSVPAEDLESLVEAGLSVKRLLNNNMREVTADDAREIYRSIL